MRKSLGYTLVATLLASGWALTGPQEDAAPASSRADSASAVAAPSSAPRPALVQLPAELAQPSLTAAAADPFVSVPPPMVAPPTPVAPPAPPPAPAPPPPPPPALEARFIGVLAGPAGERRLFVSAGAAEHALLPGDRLPNGFVLKRLEPQSAVFVHEASGTEQSLLLPAASAN